MIDGMVMILFAVILFLVAVFVWAYKDQQYVKREIEWGKHEKQIVIIVSGLIERHYDVMKCIDDKIKFADNLRTLVKELDYGEDLGYWNGAYNVLKELKEEIENDDKFTIEKFTEEM